MAREAEPVLRITGLKKYFHNAGGSGLFHKSVTNAVDDVELSVYPGETLGIVGESGCGKSTVAKLLLGLEKPTDGQIFFMGQRIDNLTERKRKALRTQIQMVFQDSGASLNPRKQIYDILAEPMRYHKLVEPDREAARVAELLSLVGLSEDVKDRYPHEFSGGQRQRICIARALSLNPKLLVLDEPVSALDVSVQAQILNLFRELQKKLGLTCLFIGHGLAAVHYVSDRIAVMYLGKVLECGAVEEVFHAPAHPYTRALLDATPVTDPSLRREDRLLVKGEGKLAGKPAEGCAFYARCPFAQENCRTKELPLVPVAEGSGHVSRCREAYPADRKEKADV